MFKEKITYEGQLCRKCVTPVVRREGRGKLRPGRKYYFKYYFYCNGCNTFYYVDSAKVYPNTLF